MTLAEQMALQEHNARHSNWDSWILDHPELTVHKDDDGKITSIDFPAETQSSMLGISNGEVSFLQYIKEGEEFPVTFNPSNFSFVHTHGVKKDH